MMDIYVFIEKMISYMIIIKKYYLVSVQTDFTAAMRIKSLKYFFQI